jgi:2-desacetyl-2-hydroxyethyl bacteriochlorophyllide A dehydrogenase
MRAAVFGGPGVLELKDIPTPTAPDGGLLLRVGANTVCGTDLRILRGEKSAGIDVGVVLGHEIAGEVVEVGAGTVGYAEGDRIGLLPTVPCGRCAYCRRGRENLCSDSEIFGYRLNGGLAEYIEIPATAISRGGVGKVPSSVPFSSIALAEPLSCVLGASDSYGINAGETVVILGAGPIGLLHAQVVRLAGATTVIVSDPSASRREVAEKLGATHTVDPTATDLREFVLELTDGLGADLAIVAIGMPVLFAQALGVVRKRGRVNAFAGFPKDGVAEIDPNLIHYGEITVTGASNSTRVDHERALKLIASGAIDVASLVTHEFTLDDVVEAIEFSASGEGIKISVSA